MKKLLLGNEAVARGLYEAGVCLVSSYPGTPSTEITEFACGYGSVNCEWAPNEKVALEVASGASISGSRAFCAMKHVGLNVAADPLYTMSYIGVGGGLVIAVADDPGMHSSQNEQDSRNHAKASKIPMLEPSDSKECKEFTKLAFLISERFDTPVFIRLTTRIAHSRSVVELEDPEEFTAVPYAKNPAKNVMLPGFAKPRHELLEKRLESLGAFAEEFPINRTQVNNNAIGIITSGNCYQYAREVFGDDASYLKLGMVNPLPVNLIKDFACLVKKIYVVEELDDIIETHCRKIGVEVEGKGLFSRCGEFSATTVRNLIKGESLPFVSLDENLPERPPVMCAGCPHRGLFYALKRLNVYVSGDIGCYTLGAGAPLSMMDTCICMGASVSALHGRNRADNEASGKSVAVIGDSTFIHSGITGLIDIAYNSSNSVVIVLDNSTTGMTGHQQNPTTGYNIYNEPAASVNLELLCSSVGIKNIHVCDPYSVLRTKVVIEKALNEEGPSVVISRRPCALLKSVKHSPPLSVNTDMCIGCKACLGIGCPALGIRGEKCVIDENQCVGCGVCGDICPKKAIVREDVL